MTNFNAKTWRGMIIFVLTIALASASHFSVDDCKTLGFNRANLLCSTCEKLNKFKLEDIYENCRECCLKDDEDVVGQKRYPKAVLEVCTCKFGAYPQIQAFVRSERPGKYKNLGIKYVHGLDPIIKLYDSENKLEDELDIHKWDTDSVDEFLQTHLMAD